MVKAVPTGYHTVTPNLVVPDGAKAIDFYKKAFGAEEKLRMPGPDEKIMHAELKIGDSVVMLGGEMSGMGPRSPQKGGSSPVAFYIYTDKVDAAWKRAVDAGATVLMPLQDMFWGDRTGQVEDPFGHRWSLAQHVKDMTPEEIKKGQEAFFKKMAQPA
jgi:PhnB protein